MNLEKKKALASRALGISKQRIVFLPSRLEEIKEAITKQDIKDLYEHGAIITKERKGRRKKEHKKRKKKTPGNVRKKVKAKKRKYVIITRKLRKHIRYLKDKEEITKEKARESRNKIRNRQFKNLVSLEDYLKNNILTKTKKKKNENTKKKKKRK